MDDSPKWEGGSDGVTAEWEGGSDGVADDPPKCEELCMLCEDARAWFASIGGTTVMVTECCWPSTVEHEHLCWECLRAEMGIPPLTHLRAFVQERTFIREPRGAKQATATREATATTEDPTTKATASTEATATTEDTEDKGDSLNGGDSYDRGRRGQMR